MVTNKIRMRNILTFINDKLIDLVDLVDHNQLTKTNLKKYFF